MSFCVTVFFMNQQFLCPRVTPQNIFKNIWFSLRYSQKYFQLSGFATWRLQNIWVMISGNWSISEYCYREITKIPGSLTMFMGKITRKLTKRQKFWVNFKTMIPRNCQPLNIVTQKLKNTWVMIPRDCSITKYCYPEIATKKLNVFSKKLSENKIKF